MSFICQPANSSEVITSCENDVVIGYFKRLFGEDFIASYYSSGSPALVDSALQSGDLNVIALSLQILAWFSILAACFVLLLASYKWVVDSANDGVAAGLAEESGVSIVGLLGRPVFSILMLFPTVSGYAIIHLIIILLALLGNAGTNKIYYAITQAAVPPLQINSDQELPNQIKIANDITSAAMQGAMNAYCMRQANYDFNTKVAPQVSEPKFYTHNLEATSNSSASNYVEHRLIWKDSTGKSNLEGDMCGSFLVKIQKRANTDIVSGLSTNILNGDKFSQYSKDLLGSTSKISLNINNFRSYISVLAYRDGFAHANGGCIPQSLSDALIKMIGGSEQGYNSSSMPVQNNLSRNICSGDSGAGAWEVLKTSENQSANPPADPNVSPINNANNDTKNFRIKELQALISSYNNNINDIIKEKISEEYAKQRNIIDSSVSGIHEEVLSKGWVYAGIGQQRLRELARATHLSMYHSPFEVYARNITNPDVFQSNEDKEKTSQQEWLEKLVTVERAINDKMVQTSFTPPSPATQIETFVMSGNAVDVDGLMSASVKNSMVEMEAAALRTLIGANNDGTTALQRIQNTGETMSLAHKSLMTTLGLVRKVVGAINFTATTVGGSIPGGLGNGIKGAANILKDAVEFASVNIVEATEAFADIARIFATVIPSMPYIFLILAAIGWFMQILQSMYGMTLFFIMHAIPQNTFIGSQQQGYITLLSLFFRPLLIVSGFFVSFALFEVGVDLVINSFVAIHATVQGQGDGVGGLFEVLTFLTTMKWWWYVLAATMMAMTYTIFGLTQELSDNTLDWLGTNLLRGFGNMNTAGVVSTAASNMKNRHDKIKLALDRAKPNQSPDPMGNIGGNPSPNQPNGGSGGQSLGTDLGVSKDGVLTTTTSSQNIDTSKGSLTKDVLLSARTQDGHRMFEESKYNRASDMVAKALSRQNNFANRLQIQGGLMGATVGAIGSAIGATYGFRNNGLTGALTGAKQGFGAKEVAHYRSIGEVADFHRTNQAFYGISSSGNTDVGINPMTTSGHIGSDNIGNMSNSIANDPSPSPAPTANNQADNMNTITPASPSINSQSITDLPMNASQPTPNGVIHTNAAHTNAHPTNIGNTARPSDLNTSNASQPHISQTSPTTERGEFDQNNISPNNDNAINGGGSMVSASAPTHTKPLDSSTFDNQATPAHQSITNNANNASSVGKTGSTTMADANILPTSARVDGEHHNTTNLPQNTLHNNRITMPSVDTASQPVHRGSDNIMSEGNPRTPSNHTVVSPLSHSNDIAFGTSQSNDNNVATPSNIVNQNQTTQATNTASDTPKNHQNFTSNRHQEQVINPPTQTAPISGRDYVLQEHKKDLESHHSVTHTDSKEIRDLNETITQPPNTKPNKDDQEE